jgi:hypothetical protein
MPARLPSRALTDHPCGGGKPSAQAWTRQHRQLECRQIEPPPRCRGEVTRQVPQEAPGVGGGTHVIAGSWRVGAPVIPPHAPLGRLGQVDVHALPQTVGKRPRGPTRRHRALPPPWNGLSPHHERTGAGSAVVGVAAGWVLRPQGPGLPARAPPLTGARLDAPPWPRELIGVFVQGEQGVPPGAARGTRRGDPPWRLPPRRARGCFRTRRPVAAETGSTRPHATRRSAHRRPRQRARPGGGGLPASAPRGASWRPSRWRRLPARGGSSRAAARPARSNGWHVWGTGTAEGWNIAAMVGAGGCSSARRHVWTRRTVRAGAVPCWMRAESRPRWWSLHGPTSCLGRAFAVQEGS